MTGKELFKIYAILEVFLAKVSLVTQIKVFSDAFLDWLKDKEQSKFVFAAICWERSYIPLEVWQARRRDSNVVETVHADVNLEGTQCTLVGAVGKGKHFDLLKQRSLKVFDKLSFGPDSDSDSSYLQPNVEQGGLGYSGDLL